MKKKALFILCLFSFLFINAKQIEVCTTCDVSTIKEAVALAEDGDEILIKSGIYKEHGIEIDKSIHII
ncbi:MAG: nitrous oxide reductase family maturation protein NosD, partial [Flavobacteriales bacterium]|nr:nitrous oxide reductase family maturation protein NosD [Flavobacteriales bacterium]